MTELAALHPEIEGLLREVAADPQSNLLRLPRTGLRHSLRRAELPERAPTTGLRPAERELLRTCRHEVAYLLLLACYRQQITAPQNRYLVYSLNESGEVAATLERRWLALASQKLGLMSGRSILNAMALLARCVSPDGHRWPSVLELAAASSRLDPSNTAHNYAALELILAHQPASGVRMLEKFEHEAMRQRVMSLSNLIFGYESLGRLDLAYQVLQSRAWPDGGELLKSFTGLVLSAQLGNQHHAMGWAWRVSEQSVNPNDLNTLLEGLRQRRRAALWAPRERAEAVLRTTSQKIDDRLHEVADVFA
jgi:hypothetical protein